MQRLCQWNYLIKKLSEFCEEIKRLKVNIVRPNINECYADFCSDDKNFYYALGAVKNVGYDLFQI